MAKRTRAEIKKFWERGDRPTEAQCVDTWDSVKFHFDDIGEGLNDHNPLKLYTVGQAAINPANKRIYRCKFDTTVGVPITDTNYWEQLNGEIIEIAEPDDIGCAQIKAQTTASAGNFIFVRWTGLNPRGFNVYVYQPSGITENLPYVCESGDGGFWVAAAGRYVMSHAVKTALVDAQTTQDAINGNLIVQLAATLGGKINLSNPHTATITTSPFLSVLPANKSLAIISGATGPNRTLRLENTTQYELVFIVNNSPQNLKLNTALAEGNTTFYTIPPNKSVFVLKTYPANPSIPYQVFAAA